MLRDAVIGLLDVVDDVAPEPSQDRPLCCEDVGGPAQASVVGVGERIPDGPAHRCARGLGVVLGDEDLRGHPVDKIPGVYATVEEHGIVQIDGVAHIEHHPGSETEVLHPDGGGPSDHGGSYARVRLPLGRVAEAPPVEWFDHFGNGEHGIGE